MSKIDSGVNDALFSADLEVVVEGTEPIDPDTLDVVITADLSAFVAEAARIVEVDDEPSPALRIDLHEPVEALEVSSDLLIDALTYSGDLPALTKSMRQTVEVDRPFPPDFVLPSENILGGARLSPDPWFAGVLADLWRLEHTGSLEVHAARAKTTIYFDGGMPVHAEGGPHSKTLGRLLLEMELVSEAQLDAAVAASLKSISGEDRLGEVLVTQGALSLESLAKALRFQAQERILACFRFTELKYALKSGEAELEHKPRCKMSSPSLLFEGIRRYYGPARLRAILDNSLKRYPSFRGDLEKAARDLSLNAAERRFLRDIDGTRMLQLVQSSSNLDPVAAGQFLAALILGGSLELRLMPPRIVEVRTSPTLIRDEQKSRDLPRTKRKAAAIVKDTIDLKPKHEEHDTLDLPPGKGVPAPGRKSRFGARLRALRAEALFQLAKRDAVKNPEAAEPRFESAVELAPDVVEYQMFLEHTRYRLAEDEAVRKRTLEKTRQLAELAILQDDGLITAHLLLARIARGEGDVAAAQKRVDAILAIDPKNRDARREQEQLEKMRWMQSIQNLDVAETVEMPPGPPRRSLSG